MWAGSRWFPQTRINKTAGRRAAGLLVLLALVLAGDRLGAKLLERAALCSQDRFGRLYRGGMRHDVLVLGNSRAVNSFCAGEITARTGASCFNLAHNGHSTEISEAILLDYLDRNRPPRLIVLEVTNLMSAEIEAVQSLRHHSPHSPRLSALLDRYDAGNQRIADLSRLFCFNNEMFLRSLYYLGRSDQDWINHHQIPPALIQQTQVDHPFDYGEPVPENLAALGRILQVCRERNIRCELVIAPFLPGYRRKFQNWDTWKDNLQKALPDGVKLRDESLSVPLAEHFADRVHLNLNGSRALLDKLLADGCFRGF